MRFVSIVALLIASFTFRVGAQTHASPEHLFQEALDAQNQGDFDSAARRYREAVKIAPGLLPAWVNLGVSLVKLGRFDEAVQSYQTALALDPQNRQIQFYLGLAYFKSGNAQSASQQFEELLRSNSKDVRAATLLAASYLQLGDSSRALSALEPLVSVAGDDRDFLWALAGAQVAAGKIRDGVSSAEKVGRQSDSAEAWKLAGENLLRLNEFPKAKEDLELAGELNPHLPGVQALLGQAREKNADYSGAINAFHKAVDQDPKDFGSWLNLGSDQYFTRDLDAARGSLKQALTLNSRSAPALYALALVDKSQGKPAEAISHLETAVTIIPSWIEAHVQLASLYMQARRPAEGARERAIVDKLTEDERTSGPGKY